MNELTKREWIILQQALVLSSDIAADDVSRFPWDWDDGEPPKPNEFDALAKKVGEMPHGP